MKKLANRWDIVILAVAAVCAALLVWRFLATDTGHVAVVEYNNTVVAELDLSQDAVYHISADLEVTLAVEDGSVRFVGSLCPDKVCEQFGRLSKTGDYAVCIPARVVVRIKK